MKGETKRKDDRDKGVYRGRYITGRYKKRSMRD